MNCSIKHLITLTCILSSGFAQARFPDNGFIKPNITSDIESSSFYREDCKYPANRPNNNGIHQYVWDSGKKYLVINSEYMALNPCVARRGWIRKQRTNYYRYKAPYSRSKPNWILHHNLEPAWAFGYSQLGIPGQSYPIRTPSPRNDPFEFLPQNVGGHYRAHLISDASYPNAGIPRGGLPFISIGAFSKKNNYGNPLGRAYKDFLRGSRLKFDAKFFDAAVRNIYTGHYNGNGIKLFGSFQLFIQATWGGENRMVNIRLGQGNGTAGGEAFLKTKWNWPISESAFDKGAEIVITNATDLKSYCGPSVGQLPNTLIIRPGQLNSYRPVSRYYDLNLSRIFDCISDRGLFSERMPYSAPITGVLWATETTGHNSVWGSIMWNSVENMRIDY